MNKWKYPHVLETIILMTGDDKMNRIASRSTELLLITTLIFSINITAVMADNAGEEQPTSFPSIEAGIEYRLGPLPPAPETWITGVDADKLAEIVLPSSAVLKRTDLGEMEMDFGVRRRYSSPTGRYGIQIGVYPDQRAAADALTRTIMYRSTSVAQGAGFGDRSAISDHMVAVLVANAVIWVQSSPAPGFEEMAAIGQILADAMTKGERFVTRGKVIPSPTLSFPSLTARVEAGTQLSVPAQVTDADPAKFLYKIEPRIGHIILGNPPVYSYYASKRAEEAGRKSAVITIANENNVIGSATLDFEVIPE